MRGLEVELHRPDGADVARGHERRRRSRHPPRRMGAKLLAADPLRAAVPAPQPILDVGSRLAAKGLESGHFSNASGFPALLNISRISG